VPGATDALAQSRLRDPEVACKVRVGLFFQHVGLDRVALCIGEARERGKQRFRCRGCVDERFDALKRGVAVGEALHAEPASRPILCSTAFQAVSQLVTRDAQQPTNRTLTLVTEPVRPNNRSRERLNRQVSSKLGFRVRRARKAAMMASYRT